MVRVRNERGTADKKPPSGYASWLEFWEIKQGRKAWSCKVLDCLGSADVGGHVTIVGEGYREYILPMCYACNNAPGDITFEVLGSDLVAVP